MNESVGQTYAKASFDSAEPLIVRPKNQTFYPGVIQCSSTHGTWLGGRVNGRSCETIIADLLRRQSQNQDLCVSCGVAVGDGPIRCSRKQLASLADDACSDRNF